MQRLHISISENLFMWLKKKAADETRSVNNCISAILEQEKRKATLGKDSKLKSQPQQK